MMVSDMDNPIKPLQKNHYLITQLALVDEHGDPIEKPFKLHEGGNVFKCVATYVDGSTTYYEPYWSCPLGYKSGGGDSWGVFGGSRRSSVTVNASPRHERYTELGCWVFKPSTVPGVEVVHDSTGFDYSLIKQEPAP